MSKITETAQAVLEKRYFLKDKDGELLETEWKHLCARVSNTFGKKLGESSKFYKIMLDLDFLPNSPALMNSGTEIKAYSACYVLPIGDSIEEIYKFYSDAALISKSGGGVGCNYSPLRPSDSLVGTTNGVASGPLSFMRIQDVSTEEIKQGGKRRGANMGILDCEHPDILDFIRAKDTPGVLENFNLSVRVSDHFMNNIVSSEDNYTGVERDKELWDELMYRAWSSAEPGILFGDTIEYGNLVPHMGKLEATNPCGEQPLFPYENCCLGSINLANHVWYERDSFDGSNGGDKSVHWGKLQETVHTSVLFLNRILDASVLPIPECQEAMEKTRKIGLGIMGLHDMLIQLGLPYDSEEGRNCASDIMAFIAGEAGQASVELGELEGIYKGHDGSMVRRNAHLTTIAPTGTLSMIADCSSGCEPYFAPVTYKSVLDTNFAMPNKWFERDLRSFAAVEDISYSYEELLEDPKLWPGWIKELHKGAQDIHWKDHVLMQAELQKFVDSSISKTINMAADATVEDVKEAYEFAWRKGCKGITIYRDGSRESQVLSTDSEHNGEVEVPNTKGDSGLDEHISRGDRGVYDGPFKLDLPDTLNARRYRIRDHNGRKVYFTVSLYDDEPVEVFARCSEEDGDSTMHTMSRLISLAMRYSIPLDDITKQLRKSSGHVGDTPSKLARILDEYKEIPDSVIDDMAADLGVTRKELEEHAVATVVGPLGDRCPECDSLVNPEGGCFTCHVCGWEKCS